MIVFDGVSKRFGSLVAVEDMTFSIQKGEVVGFVGANGAGKTTAIGMLLGFLSSTRGQIRINNQLVTTANAHRFHDKIGYAAGDMELPAHLTGRQYLQFVLHQARGDHQARYEELQRRFSPQLDKKIANLSRGNKQKIALVAAFVTEPELLVLDEPTSGLDPGMQEVFLKSILEYRHSGGTVFMSSHYLSEVTDVCSRVLMMKSGRLIEDISTTELLKAGGKTVRIVSADRGVKPPKGAENVEIARRGEAVELTFVFKDSPGSLQRWLASVKQLRDIEITEFSLEGAFHSLYEPESKEEQP